MTKDYSELKQEHVPLTVKSDTSISTLSKECVYLEDYVWLEQRYNLLLEYVKEKTGSCDEEIKHFVCDKWQRANSYWCRCSLDYAFATDDEIQESYNYEPPEEEKKDIMNKIKKIKSEYINKYKFSIWYSENKNEIITKEQNKNTSSDTKESNEIAELTNELKKAKKSIMELKTVAEYYKDRYMNTKSIIDYIVNNKILSKQILAQSKPKKLAKEIEEKLKFLPKYIKEKWELPTI